MSHSSLDEHILRRVRKGDPEACDVFFEHYYDRVYGYAVRLLRDPALAEDMTHEAFLRLHRALDRLDPSRDPGGWVFTTVANTVRDLWKSKHYREQQREIDVDELWNTPPSGDADSPHDQLEKKESRATLAEAMGELSPADREILLLRSYEEMPTDDVAQILQIQPDAVRQRHSRAVRRLAERYNRLAGEDRQPI